MTEEELRAKILELEDTISELNEKVTTHETSYNELKDKYDTETKMYEDRVGDLKEYNRELFLKVSKQNPVETPSEPPTETTSIDDVIKTFI